MAADDPTRPARQRITFRGRVQGVGFRATCAEISRRHTVTGWVRNEPDGSVVLEAQGAMDEIGRFVDEILMVMSRNVREHTSIAAEPAADERSFRVTY